MTSVNDYEQPSNKTVVLSLIFLILVYIAKPIAIALNLKTDIDDISIAKHFFQTTGTLLAVVAIAWFLTKNKSTASQARGRLYAAAILLLGQLASIYNANQ
jgi:uncharacterized membrane protein YbjE (DUF340 family)